MSLRRLASACVAGLACTAAYAQQRTTPAGGSAILLLLQALLSLAVVIGVIYLVYYALRRLHDRQLGTDSEGPLRVLQARHLGGDRWLYLVQVGRRTLVVGGAPGQVTPIADLGETSVKDDETDAPLR